MKVAVKVATGIANVKVDEFVGVNAVVFVGRMAVCVNVKVGGTAVKVGVFVGREGGLFTGIFVGVPVGFLLTQSGLTFELAWTTLTGNKPNQTKRIGKRTMGKRFRINFKKIFKHFLQIAGHKNIFS